MSKKHKHHRPVEPHQPQGESVDQDALAQSLGGDVEAPEVDDTDTSEHDEVAGDHENNEETPSDQTPAEEVTAPDEEKPVTVSAPTPKAPEVKAVDLEKQTPKAPAVRMITPRRKVAVAPAQKAKVTQINADSSDDPKMHTREGRSLMRAFDEYEQLLNVTKDDDRDRQIVLAKKLFDIMGTCCPMRGNPNNGVIQELIKITFKRLSNGYGTMYKDSTLLRQDYNLPSPADAMKFDTFWTVMWQLVECAKTGRRISYNTTTVSKIINSPAAMVTINSIRRRLEER